MPRYKLILEYDGCRFSGWQRQPNRVTVQGTLEQSLQSMFNAQIQVEGAGRTDAGVHALGQVAHFDLPCELPAYRICDGLNYYLHNRGVAILGAEMVPSEFHARFWATNRIYEYHILNRRGPAVLVAQRAWHVIVPLDIDRMKAAASHLLGHHDFTSFRATTCQAPSPLKTLNAFEITQIPGQQFLEGDSDRSIYIKARIESRSFLHNQVRIMIGTLKLVGEGRLDPGDITAIFKARARCASGPTAPPQGLYLKSISY